MIKNYLSYNQKHMGCCGVGKGLLHRADDRAEKDVHVSPVDRFARLDAQEIQTA